MISSFISGYFFSIGATLWQFTTEDKLNLPSPFWLVSVPLGIIGVLLLIYGIYLEKHELAPQGENITIPAPSQKRAGWFSRLRRSPVKKEKRADFWTNMIMMIIIGAAMIAIALSFSSASLPQGATFTFHIIKYTMIGAGILMITLSAWLTITELYAMWESRTHLITNRKITYLNVIKDFDKSFQNLKQATQPKTRETMLAEFQDKLRNLCDLHWNDEVNNRIVKVLEYIPEKLSDDPHVDYYLLFLRMIINFYGKHTITTIKGKFLVELENLYNTAKFDKILSMLQTLHGHSEEYIMKLVNDAGSTDQWSDSRFNSSMPNIEFWELRSRNQEAYNRVLQYLRQKMDDAERNKDEKTYDRFKKLWESAKRS